ncbi:isochorismatase family protein [Tuwongella immobilis]|uniref:Isochorismatase-like domain-containing protein n=1 Tax=Tuwongella immobilis TaxID=692036 RepID=A0A6C2YR32_9BACT|nr:isochorismatase family protein [Tuwongella immobilis]VIP03563.1 nicotinamidase-like amidase : Isochorismatase hydrolase OS=Methanosphaerula palustris (strain ATCC BAA-1556 / DSM 19958 / E1-9c) GN=Mpal_0905 PE=4 SV=1: Isochorismatase [Tuwongella immobilis]VTS04494.1 nicotinamidase-like amidase : Isochorismatase hydrolase OS=Methanosphaerula palustris (strain ATCC BAA-1556 / DSM 19958 / E1-9c) GN=Mpal_0905 PE=4 SV=1: Isochorismatase [Tuwongella immobilis]
MPWSPIRDAMVHSTLVLLDYHDRHRELNWLDCSFQQLCANALQLLEAAEHLHMPVVVSLAQTPLQEAEWCGELRGRYPKISPILRNQWNPWRTPAFQRAIRRTQRRHLILAGMPVETILQAVAISAVQDGYSVTAVLDASGTESWQEWYEAIAWMEALGVSCLTTAEFLGKIQSSGYLPIAPTNWERYIPQWYACWGAAAQCDWS